MKRNALVLIILMAALLAAHAADRRRDFILDTLKRFAPQGYHIINAIETTPESGSIGGITWNWKRMDYMAYIKAHDDLGIVKMFNTLVHEENHSYTLSFAMTMSREALENPLSRYWAFFTGTETVIVKLSETFPSKEMASTVPAQFRGDRYQHYIDSKKMMTTQNRGIYGLLDEFNSYCQGTRVAVDMYDWYMLEKRQSAAGWGDLFLEARKTYMAHMEFRLYILRYLIYARKHYPAIYRDVMANVPFKKVFAAVDGNWRRVVADMHDNARHIARVKYNRAMSVEIKYLAGPGAPYLKLTHDGTSEWLCLSPVESEYRNYEKEMAKPEYREVLAELSPGSAGR